MKVNQIYEILNTITQEVLGESIVVAEDLSNLVDVGKAYENIDGALDNYVRRLPDHIGRMVIVNRLYTASVPSLVRDSWEYGAMLEKISFELPEAQENEAWNLQRGASYDPNVFTPPEVNVRFWNRRVTYQIPMSITRDQAKSAFSSAVQLNAFYSGIQTAISNAMSLNTESLCRRVINNLIADTIYSDYAGADLTASSHVKAVNLLYEYNQTIDEANALTPGEAIRNPEFLRFAAYRMRLYADRMRGMSTLFNMDGRARFTPSEDLRVLMLSEFAQAVGVYLYDANGQFLTDDLRFPSAETLPFWQGSGQNYSFDNTSTINVTTASGHAVTAEGILAVMYDRDAAGVCNEDPHTESIWNPVGEFWNEWHKWFAGLWNAADEQCVVFFVA